MTVEQYLKQRIPSFDITYDRPDAVGALTNNLKGKAKYDFTEQIVNRYLEDKYAMTLEELDEIIEEFCPERLV